MRSEVTKAIANALTRLEALGEEAGKKAAENKCLQPIELVAFNRRLKVETAIIRDEVEKARGQRDRRPPGAAK